MNPKKVVANNLQKLLDDKGITQTQMANTLGYPEMTVSNWMKAKTYPRIDRVQEMADYFGVRRSDITDEKIKSIKTISLSDYPYLPEPISAGLPNSVDGITETDTISIPDALMGKHAGNRQIYVTRVNGESMNNVMPDNSIIAVKPINLNDLKNGDIVVYKHNQEYAVKRFYKNEDTLIFRPDSSENYFTDNVIDINNADDLKIKGKVVMHSVLHD